MSALPPKSGHRLGHSRRQLCRRRGTSLAADARFGADFDPTATSARVSQLLWSLPRRNLNPYDHRVRQAEHEAAGISFDTRVGQPPHNMTTHNHDLQPTLTTLSIRPTYRAPNVSPT